MLKQHIKDNLLLFSAFCILCLSIMIYVMSDSYKTRDSIAVVDNATVTFANEESDDVSSDTTATVIMRLAGDEDDTNTETGPITTAADADTATIPEIITEPESEITEAETTAEAVDFTIEPETSPADTTELSSEVTAVPETEAVTTVADVSTESEAPPQPAETEEITAETSPPIVAESNATVLLSAETEPPITYILNKNTKKFHLPTCLSVKDMKESNKLEGNDREKIIAEGYVPCKRCKP